MQETRNENRFEIIRLDFGGRQYYLALQGFLVFDPPLESRSSKQGSTAFYYAAHKEEGLLLQYLHGLTSSHDHEIWIEDYFLLTGEAVLYISGDQHLLTEAAPIGPTVTPGLIHQVSAPNEPSLILIRIKGDPDWFEKWLTGRGHRFKNF